ncbi:MAG: type II toxin-antitoxin system death-on-curing family toxin [Thaumarchaeota archaeon]|nr:type II toxin-antitoxin system death-on-curing family toxin [Nitrososphaerota archaeon]
MATKAIRHLDFATLLLINKEVVALTNEKHEHDEEDDRRLRALTDAVVRNYNQEDREIALVRKAALLAFRIATGQHFHEGNKRTALVAASAFLKFNGCSIDIKADGLVSVIDRVGVARATLNELEAVMKKLVRVE